MTKLPRSLSRPLRIAFGLWLSAFGNSAIAASTEILSTNDLSKHVDSTYQVSGIDPFVVIKLEDEATTAGNITVDLGTEISDIKLELFFKSRQSIFDPHYKASYRVDHFPVSLKLPTGALKSNILRIDIVGCPSCRLDLSNLISSDQSSRSSKLLEPIEILNGLKQLNADGQVLQLNDWSLNDLGGTLTEFEITADDPFLVSPKLDLSTRGLAGVYFKFEAPSSNQAWDSYQFFYQTEHHGFSLKASSDMRISQNKHGQESETAELFIPLSFLADDFPPSKSLKQIRLDLPLIDGKWALLESKLIHDSQLEQYLALKPKQLVHTKLQRATGLRLIKKSLLNVLADRWFVASYLLLIITVIIVFFRAFRRYK